VLGQLTVGAVDKRVLPAKVFESVDVAKKEHTTALLEDRLPPRKAGVAQPRREQPCLSVTSTDGIIAEAQIPEVHLHVLACNRSSRDAYPWMRGESVFVRISSGWLLSKDSAL